MTLTSELNRVEYSPDGNDVSFAVTFVFWEADDPLLTLRDALGVETAWVRGTQYTMAGGSGSTGTATVITSPTDYTPANGTTLVITSNLADTQDTDLPEGGPFPSTSVEQQMDKTVRMVQQGGEEDNRRLHYPISDLSSLSSELPNSDDRADSRLGFDSSGEPIAVTNDITGVAATAFGTSLVQSSNASAGRTVLEIDGSSGVIAAGDLAADFQINIIGGLTTSNGTDTDHDIDIAVGYARDAGNAVTMVLSSALTKLIDATWALGDDAGGLDTGAVANTTLYAVWLIRRSDTGVVDALFSTSFTAPTMPAGGAYDQKRLIGAVTTDGSANIIAYTQSGDYFRYTGDIITDISDATITDETFEVGALSIPPSCLAHIYASALNTSNTTALARLFVRTNGAADALTSFEAVALGRVDAASDVLEAGGFVSVLVDSSSQIQYAADEDAGATTVTISTIGFDMLTRREP